ncbi:uncharacterized protein LOC131428755 [Malaya genurostris]|uniref:uncharacterized protein LOC131428755 n=1 Tax=Malaya genurostris TaxID=325434 RepID=UPI0026F3B25D|nr:uncharacterized protein LOC131428755 [Malaya genurostris]
MILQWTVLLVPLFITYNVVESKSTMEQMAKAGEMMRNVCIGKFKATVEQIEALGRGEFIDSKEVKCYANCVLEMMQAMRKGKVTADAAIKQIDMVIPPEIGEPTKQAIDVCRNSADGIKNNCEAAFALLKCIHQNNPKYFFAYLQSVAYDLMPKLFRMSQVTFLIILGSCIVGSIGVSGSMTTGELVSIVNMLRSYCQPKFGISDEIATSLSKGEFPNTRSFKCYVSCMFELALPSKGGKYSYEDAVKQIQLLPQEYQKPFRQTLRICKNAADGISDPCNRAYALFTCFYDATPKLYFPW